MRESFHRYRRQATDFWGELSNPQRLSLGALGLTVLVALVLLVSWGSTDDLEPVFYTGYSEIDAEQRGRIEAKLTELGIPFEYRGGILHVPAGEKERVVAALYAEPGVLPGTDDVWAWIWEPDWTGTESRTRRKVTISLERKLARMIGSFDNVRDAEVQIAPGDNNRTFATENPARASVLIRLKDRSNYLSKQQVVAITQMLAGSVQDLKAADVQLSDTSGRHYAVPDQDEFGTMPLDQLEIKQAFDEYYTRIAREALGPERDVAYVTASVDVDMSKAEEWIREVPKGQASVKVSRRERDRTSRIEGPEEPGVVTNVEEELVSGPSTETETEVEEVIEYVNDEKRVQRTIPPGMVKSKKVVVYIPYERAVAGPSGAVPDDEAAREANRQAAMVRYKTALKTIHNLQDADVHIDIRAFPEEEPFPEPGLAEYTQFVLEEHGGEIFLGLLALAAVAIVARTIQLSVPKTPEETVVIEEEEIDERLEALMRARTPGRFDPRTQVLRDKIQDIIDENPRGVGAMLRQWARKE